MKRLLIIFVLLSSVIIPAKASEYFKNKYYPESLQWQRSDTEHFRIIYPKGQEDLLPATAQFAEDAYDFNGDIFKLDLDDRIYIIVYPSPQLFAQTQIIPYILPPNIGGFATFKDDRVVVPFNGDITYYRELLYHEISHIYQYHKFYKNPLAGLISKKFDMPTWVFEGLSEHATENWDNPKFMILKDAALNGNIHDVEYFHNPGNLDYLGYQEAHSLVEFLLKEGGELKFDNLLKDLNATLDIDESLQKIYVEDLEEIYLKWHRELTLDMHHWSSERTSIFRYKKDFHPANSLLTFRKGQFYITMDKSRLVRKIRGRKEYSETIVDPGPFEMIMAGEKLMALNGDETRLAFISYKNAEFFINTYDFVRRTLDSHPLKDVTSIKQVFYHEGSVYMLVKEGLGSKLLELEKAGGLSEQPLEYRNSDGIVITGDSQIEFSTVGKETYIHKDDSTLNISGTFIHAEAYTDNSLILLVTRESDNILIHYNMKNGEFTAFPPFRETITNFTFDDKGMVLSYYWNGKYRKMTADFPDYTGKIKTYDIYRTPELADSLYYETEDFQGKRFGDPLRFSGFIYGFTISENKYLKLNSGLMMDTILNEAQLAAYIGYYAGGSNELDFAILYRRSGNRPSYGASFIKDSFHRNDELYTYSRLSGDLVYPLSLNDSLKAEGGVRFTGFIEDKTEASPYGGISFIRDTAYGRIYPDYGMRLYLYGGASGEDDFSFETENDLRFYHMPVMLRLYYRYSKAEYLDDNYLRGYRDTYFPAEQKFIINMEIRTPMITIIPGFYSSFTLPPVSAFVFADAGLFTDDPGSSVLLEEGRLIDPVASVGGGMSLHLSSSMSLEMSFAWKTDIETIEQEPVVEFSVNRLFY